MPYNFHQSSSIRLWKEICCCLIIIWLVVIRNFFEIQSLDTHLSNPPQIQQKKASPILSLCSAIANLPTTDSVIHKIDIQPHEMFLFGKAVREEDLTKLLNYFKNINAYFRVEVRQWDYIKTNHWRFIIALVY